MAEQNLINSAINLGLPAQVPENFTHPEIVAAVKMFIQAMQTLQVAIEAATGFTQKDASLWPSLLPSDTLLRQNLGRLYCMASEDLNYGAFVHLWNDSGVLKARNANSTDHTKPARGYCNNTEGILANNFCEIIVGQGLLKINSLAPGTPLWLSITDGLAALTPDTAAGHLEQFVGFGVGNELAFIDISPGIEH